ncbi:unnamed protein product [Clavelina lepadiformis]|uniref:O-fucosyltransferase family protein n=1 Tax=Clavelina lepadiformis TaxID=159417 RepID=A0ABP0GR52_CLALP
MALRLKSGQMFPLSKFCWRYTVAFLFIGVVLFPFVYLSQQYEKINPRSDQTNRPELNKAAFKQPNKPAVDPKTSENIVGKARNAVVVSEDISLPETGEEAIVDDKNAKLSDKNLDQLSARFTEDEDEELIGSKKESPELLNDLDNSVETRLDEKNVDKVETVAEILDEPVRPLAIEDCDLWKIGDDWTPKAPQISLDPNKFLYPGLFGGPNNQIYGLRQSVYLAIRLNRTVVLPQFFGHVTTGRGAINPSERIDVRHLCRFVSCISVAQQKEKCGKNFDVVFKAMIPTPVVIARVEMDTGLMIRHDLGKRKLIPGAISLVTAKGKVIEDMPSLPGNDSMVRYGAWLESDGSTLRKIYHTSAPCAFHASTFSSIAITYKDGLALPLKGSSIDPEKIPDQRLYSAVVEAIQSPPIIKMAAEAYIKTVLRGEKYVAAHWRYDYVDWKRNGSRANKQDIVQVVEKATAPDLAKGIINSTPIETNRGVFVYLAMPPSLNQFKEDVYGNLTTLNPLFKKPPISVESFLQGKVEKCWTINNWSNIGEVYSQIENQIALKSERFLFSISSTWSGNVRPFRQQQSASGKKLRKFEISFLKLVNSETSKRLKKTG